METGEIFEILEKECGILKDSDPIDIKTRLEKKLKNKDIQWLRSLQETVKREIERLDSIFEYDKSYDYLKDIPIYIGLSISIILLVLFLLGVFKTTLVSDLLQALTDLLSNNNKKLGVTFCVLMNRIGPPVFLAPIIIYSFNWMSEKIELDSIIEGKKIEKHKKEHPDYGLLWFMSVGINTAIANKEASILKGKFEDEEADEYDVVLLGLGKSPNDVIYVIRKENSLDSMETLKLIMSIPPIVGTKLPKQDAKKLAEKLKSAGAEVDLFNSNKDNE
jgi:ribosomal protein L7/L12